MAQNQSSQQSSGILVYIVERYGQILGVYDNQEDAVQFQKLSIAKNNFANIIVKPLITKQNGKS